MTEAEQAFVDGWEQARRQMILAISMVRPHGEAQERYQRLIATAVNTSPSPVADAPPDAVKDNGSYARFGALRDRVRPPTVKDREPGEDDVAPGEEWP